VGALAGVVAGLAVTLFVVGSGRLDDRVAVRPLPDASDAFVSAFERSLEGTYLVRATFTRVLTDGRTMTSNAGVAQRPPDTIRRGFGGLSGSVDGHQVVCSTQADGRFHCGPGAVAPDHADVVRQDLANLRSYFTAPALYRAVQTDPDCFELTQARPSGVVPYGSFARFCFDPETGAIRLLKQDLEGATDTFEATLVRPDVTDQDLSLDDDPAFQMQTDPGADVTGDTTGDTTATPVPTAGPGTSATDAPG
jgi:hypothetical protein